MQVIENEYLKVAVNDFGAELSSVYDKKEEVERIWSADPSVWNRHAPILFPFVGKVKDQVYRVGDRECSMKTQHGFARDMSFTCIEKTDTAITHQLIATESTREIYPWDFELLVAHRLDAKNPRILHVDWQVTNHSDTRMYYSIGAHPGFALPVKDFRDREHYYLLFPGREELTYISAGPNGLAMPQTPKQLHLQNGLVKYFDDIYSTFIFDFQDISEVAIAKPNGDPYVTVRCPGFPQLGIWTNESGGNYICLEPWYGRADDDGFAGTIDQKPGVQHLAPGETANMTYSMEFHK